MNKHLRLLLSFLFVMLLGALPTASFGQNPQTKTLSDDGYIKAKAEIEDMLNGKTPLSYERSIYLIENAWLDNKLSYANFQDVISDGVNHIKTIKQQEQFKVSTEEPSNFFDALRQKKNREGGYLENAETNYSIYTYLTDTTHFQNKSNNSTEIHSPYRYAFGDPLGTIDWKNTQVTHLLLSGKGNCFALASLYKIYSERLQSQADICTAPGHVYITHKDANGIQYNIELASKEFPGTGTLSTLTYTTQDAIRNNISLRQLDSKQSVALCFVYLAKGHENKYGATPDDSFSMECAEAALKYDSLDLNAILLKAELLERKLVSADKPISELRATPAFEEYQNVITSLYKLGYREMPLDMKNILIKGWSRDTVTHLANKSYLPVGADSNGLKPTRYASLSWGLFDEEIADKPVERYGRTLFDTKSLSIKGFVEEQALYNNYNFDPVLFALNVDPLASKFPSVSPYAFANNNPIFYVDPTGAAPNPFRIMADFFRSFTQQTTASMIKTAAQAGHFSASGNGTYAITRLGRIYESAVLESFGEDKNTTRFAVPGSNRTVIPDLAGISAVTHINPLNPSGDRDLMEFPNANFTDVKFKSSITLKDENNPDQLRGMIDVLSNMKGGYKNGDWDASLKASDYGAASLTLVTPGNATVDQSILDYATKSNVKIFQRTTQVDSSDPNRMRVGDGSTLLNSVSTQTDATSIPKGAGQSTPIDYNVR